jgi:hypothetical protein
MRFVSFAQAASYFDVAGKARVNWRSLEHPAVQRFSEAVFKLSKLSRLQDDDTGWRRFLYPARRARNILTTVPLPYNSAAVGLPDLMSQLSALLPMLRIYAGEEAVRLGQEAVEVGTELAGLGYSPVLDMVLNLAGDTEVESDGLLLPLNDFLGSVRDHLKLRLGAHQTAVHALTWHDLAESRLFDRLIVIGPLYWYHDHEFVFTSPRAPRIEVAEWAWYREPVPTADVLAGSSGGAMLRVVPPPVRSAFVITEADERPEVDWHSVSRDLAGRGEGQFAEPVLARPVLLARGFAALFPEEGERPVWMLDPYAPAEHRVVRVDVADLEPGHVVILRTSGGGDLIVPTADEILGAKAERLRTLQGMWKAKLADWVLGQGGLNRAAEELQRMGCLRAYPHNLQYWLGERSLRTDDPDDWRIIMRAASLEDRTAEIWQAMGRIGSAHRAAGRSLGRRLREMAGTADLDELLATGRQVFAELHGGSLTAFRVEGFAPVTVRCTTSHLMTPVQMRNEWLS